jgi:hypothetical protein
MSSVHRARELEVLKELPRPPKNMHLATEAQILDWLKACADHSAEGIRTAFAAHNFPGTPQQRLSVWGRFAEYEREAQARELTQQQKADADRRDKLRAAEDKALKRMGWLQG